MVCSSNQNRSMEAHSLLKRHGFDVASYGTGTHISDQICERRMGILFTRMLSSLFGNWYARILVHGLDNAGKTTILCFTWLMLPVHCSIRWRKGRCLHGPQSWESAGMEDPNSRRKTDIASMIHAEPFYPPSTRLTCPAPYASQVSHATPYRYWMTSSNYPYQQEYNPHVGYTQYSWQGEPPPVQHIFPPRIHHPQPPNTAGGFPPRIHHPQPPNTAGGFPPRIHHPQPPNTAGGFPPHIRHPRPPNTAGGFPSTEKSSSDCMQ